MSTVLGRIDKPVQANDEMRPLEIRYRRTLVETEFPVAPLCVEL